MIRTLSSALTGQPIAAFDFANGWTASLLIQSVTVALSSYDRTNPEVRLLDEQEAFADEVVDFLIEVAGRANTPVVQAELDASDD